MNFGAELTAGLAELRHYAESRMRATCVIERKTGETTTAGVVTPTWTTIYEGKCYSRYPGLAQEANRDVSGATVTESRLIVRIPLGAACKPGDRVTIAADPDNPQMAGTVLLVESTDDQSQATAQRLLCSDPQSGVIG